MKPAPMIRAIAEPASAIKARHCWAAFRAIFPSPQKAQQAVSSMAETWLFFDHTPGGLQR